jgi:hypothetical protein
MTSHELARILLGLPDLPVVITDGFDAKCFRGRFEVKTFEGTIDIGVGGMKWTENIKRGEHGKP